jgi:hypothetical protein
LPPGRFIVFYNVFGNSGLKNNKFSIIPAPGGSHNNISIIPALRGSKNNTFSMISAPGGSQQHYVFDHTRAWRLPKQYVFHQSRVAAPKTLRFPSIPRLAAPTMCSNVSHACENIEHAALKMHGWKDGARMHCERVPLPNGKQAHLFRSWFLLP